MSENNEYSIDPLVWFSDRELKFAPKHFTTAHSLLTLDGKKWIMNKLRGRFALVHPKDGFGLDDILGTNLVPAFEDPQEAVLYELMWSS